MKRKCTSLRLGAWLLLLAILWRMIGAPVTAEEWRALDVPLWQARVLLPGRIHRVLLLWCGQGQQSQTLTDVLAVQQEAEELSLLSRQKEPVVLSVWNAQRNRLEEMELENYVYGVVAAEMPAAYHTQALRAQAVAARTRALQQHQESGCTRHPGADVCTESGHCQGYATIQTLKEKWGDEYPVYHERMMEAVLATSGQMITWEGKPILVMYHAISGGETEDAQAVFSQAVPYLVSVSSAGEENVRGFRQDAYFSFEEAAQLLSNAFPDLAITPEVLRKTLMIASHTPTGRVESVLLGTGAVKGTDFRAALGLRSTLFTFTMDSSGITFHQTGYGHGVGMSQAGANRMAAEGFMYQEILAHYYPGTTLEKH